MTKLTFVLHPETGAALARKTGSAFARTAEAIPGMLAHLEAGRDVVALMRPLSTGYRLPEGTELRFHEDCPTEGALRRQCEARADLRVSPVASQIGKTANLIYVERASRALALADRIGALAVVHPADLEKVGETLAAGTAVVMPIAMSLEDFRIPRGSGIFFDPSLGSDPRRPRAGIHAMLCGAAAVPAEIHRQITETIEELEREKVVFGAFGPVPERSEDPDFA